MAASPGSRSLSELPPAPAAGRGSRESNYSDRHAQRRPCGRPQLAEPGMAAAPGRTPQQRGRGMAAAAPLGAAGLGPPRVFAPLAAAAGLR